MWRPFVWGGYQVLGGERWVIKTDTRRQTQRLRRIPVMREMLRRIL